MEKAVALADTMQMKYDGEHHWWMVLSSDGSTWYALFRYQYQFADDTPFWREYGCTCPAQDAVLPICYHKAFLWLRLQEGELGEVA